LRFYLDPESSQPHIHRHEVYEEEVEEVLRSPREDRPGREGSRLAMGPTLAGRVLRIVYVPDPDRRGAFVVTAYPVEGKALLAFRKRQRQKGER
jgi:hypothetical protein